MAAKKVGTLIKEARTNADLTQEQLARKIAGLSAEDISLAERGKKNLTQDQLKQIAKITGVTQASLLNAAKGTSSSAKKPSSFASGTSSKTSYMVTAEEKKLIQLYRKADSETKKSVLNLLNVKANATEMILETLLGNVQNIFGGK